MQSNYESSRFYTDNLLNTIALELRNEIGALIEAMDSLMGQPTDINKEEAQQLLKKANENPVLFIKDLVEKNFIKLEQIRSAVSAEEDTYVTLSEGLIMVVVGILSMPINLAFIRAKEDISNLESSVIAKTAEELSEAKLILESLEQLQIVSGAQGQINNLLEITNNVLEKIKA